MLTGYQVETVAFLSDDGGIICTDCAVEATSAVTVSRVERGLDDGDDLSAISRYSLDELIGENAYEHANEEAGPADWRSSPDATTAQELARIAQCDAWQAAYDAYPAVYHCDSCGREIS